MAKSETEIQREILDYLEWMGIFYWRNFTQGVRTAGGRTKNKNKGAPDIFALEPTSGKLIGIEVKKPGGRVSHEQLEWMTKAAKNGALCFIAESVEDVREQFAANQIIYYQKPKM
jgi:hypothetical protein